MSGVMPVSKCVSPLKFDLFSETSRDVPVLTLKRADSVKSVYRRIEAVVVLSLWRQNIFALRVISVISFALFVISGGVRNPKAQELIACLFCSGLSLIDETLLQEARTSSVLMRSYRQTTAPPQNSS